MPKDIVEKFTSHLKNVLTRALCLVAETGADTISTEHLLWSVSTEEGSVGAEILRKSNIKPEILREFIGAPESLDFSSTLPTDALPRLSEQAKRVIEKAVLTATIYEHHYVGTEHLIAGILQVSNRHLASFFQTASVNVDDIRHQLSVIMKGTQSFPELESATNTDKSLSIPDADIQIGDLTDDINQSDLPALDYFAVELTTPDAIVDLDPVIGRDDEIERLMEILMRRTKNNPVLIGEPGVGKTAIVEGLARNIVEGNVPPALMNKRIFALDLGSLIAGTVYRGEFEGRMKQIIDEVRDEPDIVLFVDELHMIMGAGSASGSLDAANMLKPALARGWIRCIGATTPTEFKKHIESDGALERRFQSITVDEPSVEDTVEILRGLAPRYEEFHRVKISDEALVYAAEASDRYIHDNALPDKAIDLLDEAAASMRVQETSESEEPWRKWTRELRALRQDKRSAVVEERFLDASMHKEKEESLEEKIRTSQENSMSVCLGTIGVSHIARIVERRTGTRASSLLDGDRERLSNLHNMLNAEIFGQAHVIDTVSAAIRRAKTGVRSYDKPLSSFMFVGPSGTGKSELARQIALQVFENKQSLIRLDMSEYVEGYSISKLVGSPAGYVGYRDQARLTDTIKQKPHSVVLFDEIEKAHPDVLNLLLQILEHGELTDATGRNVSFKNAIIVLTSNVGAEKFESGAMGFSEDPNISHKDVVHSLKDQFRPELLNRLEHICVFNPLEAEHLKAIASRELNLLADLLKHESVEFSWSDRILKHLIEPTDVRKSGARGIKQRVQNLIADRVADHILKSPEDKELHATINKSQIDLRAKTR